MNGLLAFAKHQSLLIFGDKTSGTEILYSKYRIVLHKMSELDEISDSGIKMYSYGEAGITVFKIGA